MPSEHNSKAARRAALPGFPIETPFNSIEEVRDYLSAEKIVCLICGKSYKSLGVHLSVHEVTVDEYHQRYNIPWTYGLVCLPTAGLLSSAVTRRMEEGWIPNTQTADEFKNTILKTPKRKTFFKDEISVQNLKERAKPVHPLQEKPDGGLETFTARKHRLAAKRGTPEFKKKMRARPQVEKAKEILRTFWKGRQQTDEHVFKRTGHHKKSL